MPAFRMTSPSDVVAGAVAMGGHLPEDELVIITLDVHPCRVAVLPLLNLLPGVSEGILSSLRVTPALEECQSMLVVVFGTLERGNDVAEALETFRPDSVPPVFVFTDGLVRQWTGAGSLAAQSGTPVDLAAHPLITEALFEGTTILKTRSEIRAGFTAAQHGPERAAAASRAFGAKRIVLRAMEPQRAADRVFDLALSHYLDGTSQHGITVTDEHAAVIAAAMHDVTVRDLLFAHIDENNADAAAEVMRQVGALLPEDLAGPLMVFAGVFNWVNRRSALAREALTSGRRLDPSHSFGKMFEQVLDNGLHPAIWEQLRTAAVLAHQTQAQ